MNDIATFLLTESKLALRPCGMKNKKKKKFRLIDDVYLLCEAQTISARSARIGESSLALLHQEANRQDRSDAGRRILSGM